jgi:hypothetical protein
MSTLERLAHWRDVGAITPGQYDVLGALVRKERFSVFVELNALLYLGVLSLIAGIGWVIQKYAPHVGDVAILAGLTAVLGGCASYCSRRAVPFSTGHVESPSFAFDYVLYLGCLVFGVELAFIESRFHLMQDQWDFYLALSAVVFFVLAYRFDNRLVLSLALSTLAGWFGIRMNRFGLLQAGSLQVDGLVYGTLVSVAGLALHRRRIKPHFTETYLHVAANVLLAALVSGVFQRGGSWPYLFGLLAVAAACAMAGVRYRRFSFVAYACVYGYIGQSAQILYSLSLDETTVLGYFVVSGTIMLAALVLLARRFGREK